MYLKSDMHFALKMQCLFCCLILIYKNEHVMQFTANFLRLLGAPLFEECTGVCCKQPRSCCLGLFLVFHRAQRADNPCWGSSWGLDNAVIPVLFILYLCWCQPTQELRGAIPSFSPHPHSKSPVQQHPRQEERGSLIHPIHPSTKGMGQAHNHWHCFHCWRAKSKDLYTPGQLCWHRQSLGNVRHLKTEQMFLLKGLPQCSA